MQGPSKANWRRMAALLCGLVFAIVLGLGLAPAAFAANPQPAQYYYVPFTETELLADFDAINGAAVTPITNYTTITAVASGTWIYYDQWENGYDPDIANPANLYSSSNLGGTQIWGDGNTANGTCPGTTNDLITAGMVINLTNTVTIPRDSSILFDGRDKIGATKTIAVTRTTWAAGSGTLLAGSVEVYDYWAWGTDYVAPVGTDIPDTTDYQMFEYTTLSIMAGLDGATVQIDLDGNGTVDSTVTLSEGQTTYVTGVYAGGHIVSDNPVQVDIFTGDIGSNYESRDSALIPTGTWSTDYYTPVSTVSSAQDNTGTDTTAWLYNNGASDITVYYKRWVAGVMTIASIPVYHGQDASHPRYAKQVLTDGTGAEFYTSDGSSFYAFSTTDSNSGNSNGNGNQAWDWGFSLVPRGRLSTQLLVGLGIGRDPTSPTNPDENGNPVWVTPSIGNDTSTATIYVDYDGDPATGANTDPNGRKYDVSYSLKNLQRVRLYRGGVELDAVSTNTASPGTTITVPHTTGPTADLMLVSVTIGNSTTDATVNSVTYGSQTLTQVANVNYGSGTAGRPRVLLYALANPTIGSGTVTVTLSASRSCTVGVTTFMGADVSSGLTSALRTPATANGTGRTMAVTPTSVAADTVYSVVGIGTTGGTTPGEPTDGAGLATKSGRTWTASATGGGVRIRGAGCTLSASSTSTTMTEYQYSNGPYPWAMIGVAIKPISTVINQSGMLIYTVDSSVKLAGAWGQDPLSAYASSPGLDVGTSVPPMPEISALKDGALDTDNDSDGYIGCGDVLKYTITVYNVSRIPVPDVVIYDTIPTNTTYVAGSTTVAGSPLADDTAGDETAPDTIFPLDGNGHNVGNLAYGASVTATFKVTVNAYGTLGGASVIKNNGTGAALNVTIPVRARSAIRGKIGDYVWYDSDQDGIQDANEGGVYGVTVYLLTSGGAQVYSDSGVAITATTDVNGKYLFTGIYASTYEVSFSIPSYLEATLTKKDQGSDDGADSDPAAGGTTGVTSSFVQYGGQTDLTIDAGLVISSPTQAVVGSFNAYLSGGRVVAGWKTVSENGTAGFWLERQSGDGGDWVRVNQRIVPAVFGSPSGGSYALVDDGAQPYEPLTYRLVEMESTGSQRIHGPYQVTASLALPTDLGAGEISQGTGTARIPKTEIPTSAPENEAPASGVTVASSSPDRLRVEVTKAGLYRLEAADLVAGLGLTDARARELIRTKGVKLTTQGKSVPYVQSLDYSALYFYGQPLDSIYTAANVYWLTIGKGASMVTSQVGSKTGAATTSFVDTVSLEEDLLDATGISHDPEGDFWLWRYLVADDPVYGATTVSVDAPGALDGRTLSVSLQGLTDTGAANEHHVQVSLNGAVLGETWWTGITAHDASFAIPEGVLTPDSNEVELTALLDNGITYSMVGLDSLQLTYDRSATAVDDRLFITPSAAGPVRVDGLSSTSAWVFDLANPASPTLAKMIGSGGSAGDAWVSFATSAQRKYLVATAAGSLRPHAITATVATSLKKSGRGANYVVITAPALSGAAARLAAYRASQGLKTTVVTTTEIYDEFNYGIASPHAIQSFISYATSKWKPVPTYVVLAGEGSYDYKNNLGHGDSLVPPLMTDTGYGLAPSDVLLADVKGSDGAPEVAIGRLTALSEAELDTELAKIEAYEAAAAGTWQQTVLLSADNADEGGSFGADSDTVGAAVPTTFTVNKAYIDTVGFDPARSMLLDSFASGTLLVSYVGHAGIDQLAENDALLAGDDVAGLGSASELPVMTAFTCGVGQYGLTGIDSLGELLVKQSGAGAIAVWAPDTMEQNDESVQLGALFLQKLFGSAQAVHLGSVVQAALKAGAGKGLPVSLLRTYNLLGDPALAVNW